MSAKIKDKSKGRILVTGGAGYIGGITSRALLAEGYDVIVIDNFVKGRGFAVERNKALALTGKRFFLAEPVDISDKGRLSRVFSSHNIKAVIHFAAFTEVAESMTRPALYFYNNIINTIHLLDAMSDAGVKRMIFSSSAAVYGNPFSVPIKEDSPTAPINPYGYSKLAMERLIGHYREKSGIEWIALRYFNAAGASLDGELGEAHSPESHLIPNVIDMLERGEKAKIFGTRYKTPDGTCLRDFISVADLARAHILALELKGKDVINRPYNLGSGTGFTVGEIVEKVGRALGKPAEYEYLPPRSGDPDKLVASSEAFSKASGWKASSSAIEDIIGTAVKWYRKKPEEALEPKPTPNANENVLISEVLEELSENTVIPSELKDEIRTTLDNYTVRGHA